jgi:hypothetical protein
MGVVIANMSDLFSLTPVSRFDNAISGQKYNGKSLSDWISFINSRASFVHITNTKKKMSWRIVTALLGEKFIIDPSELKNIGVIIRANFIKSNKLIRSQKRTKNICGELCDISFDFEYMFSTVAQAFNFLDPLGDSFPLNESVFFIIRNFNYTVMSEFNLDVRIANWLNSTSFVPRLEIGLWDLGNLNESLLVTHEILSREFNPSKVLMLKNLVRAFMFISVSHDNCTPVYAQSGACEKSGYASLSPVEAQGWFDINVKNNHDFNENTNILFGNLNKMVGEFSSGSGSFKLKDIFSKLINCITGGIKVKFEGLEEILERVDSCVEGSKRVMIVLLVYSVFKLLQLSGLFSNLVLSVVGSLFVLVGVNELFGSGIWVELYQKIVSFTSSCDLTVFQASYGDLHDPVDTFLALIQMSILGKAWYYEKDMISAFKSSMNGWDKMKIDMSDSLSTWFTIFQRFSTWITEVLGTKPWMLWSGKYPELTSYIDSVNGFLSEVARDPTLTFEKGRTLEKILKQGRGVSASLPVSAIHERNLLRSVTDSLSLWKSKLGKSNFLGSGPRIKPLGVMFTGPSQIGKSEMNNVFCRLVAARCLPFERLESFVLNPSTEVYNRIIEQEYWDAWSDQSIIQIDEIGARKDVAGQNNEAFEAIRLINGNNFSLHAADIESKGMINARPILVSATSNQMKFDWTSITFPGAFDNRFEAYAVVPKTEFLKSDVDKFNFKDVKMKELDDWFYKFEHLELWRYDLGIARSSGSIHDAIIGQPISFEELVEQSVDKILKLQKKGQTILQMHDNIIKDELMKRPDNKKIALMFESVDAEIAKYRHSASKLNKVVAQSFYNKSYDALMLTYMLVIGTVLTYGSTFTRNKIEDLKFKASLVKDRFQVFYTQRDDIYAQAKVKIKEKSKSVFGCGDCIVCRHKLLTVEDLYDHRSGDLWPENAKHIYECFKSHVHMEDLEFETGLTVTNGRPWCLKLEKDVYIGTKAIKFSDGEAYAFLVRSFLYDTISGAAINRQRGLKTKIEEFFRLSQVGWFAFISNWKVTAPIAISLGVTIGMIYKFATKIFPQSSSGKSAKGKSLRRKVKTQRLVKKSVFTESATDGVIDNVMNKVLSRSQFRIGPSGEMPMGLITMLDHNIGMMPMHFAEMLTDANESRGLNVWIMPALISDDNQRVEVPFSAFVFYEEDMEETTYDLVFFTIDIKYLAPCPSIVKYFVTEEKCPSDKFYGALFVPRIIGKNLIISKEPGWINPNCSISYADVGDTMEAFNLIDAYQYHFSTERGDCGSLLVRYSVDGTPQRLLGFHVSGSRYGVGFSQSLSHERVSGMVNLIKNKNKINIVVKDVPCEEDSEVVIQGFINLGKVDGPRCPENSKIVASPLNNFVFPCETLPAVLGARKVNGELIDPLAIARKKYLTPSVYIKQDLLDLSVWSVIKTLSNKSVVNEQLIGRRDLTFDEACFGVPGHEFINGLKLSTSSGFPWCKEPNKYPGTKRKWLGPAEGSDRPAPNDQDFLRLKSSVELILKSGDVGIRETHYCVDIPKDERRSLEKVKNFNTRMVCGTSIDYLAACIIKFGAICEWLMSNRIVNGMNVGINPFCDEWNTLSAALRMNRDNVSELNWMDGDFKAFDSSHSRQLLSTWLDLCAWYYGNDDLCRRVLMEDLMNSIHVVKGRVYMWNKALPSGHFLTPLINCWLNLLLHRHSGTVSYCRKAEVEENLYNFSKGLELVENHVVTQVYGDDNLHYVDPHVQDWFNPNDHTISMKRLGYTYTNAQKTGVVGGFLRWGELTFLKRKFRFSDNLKQVIAPLSLETIRDMIQWTKKKDDKLEDCKKTIQTALKELSFHEEDVFRENTEKIIKGCTLKMLWVPDVISYEVLLRMNSGRTEYL